jgi:hypothetical protein
MDIVRSLKFIKIFIFLKYELFLQVVLFNGFLKIIKLRDVSKHYKTNQFHAFS